MFLLFVEGCVEELEDELLLFSREELDNYDSVGRLSSFQGNLGFGSTRTYASGVQYNAFGAISREYFAGMTSPLYRKTDFNSRGQLTETGLSTDGFNLDGGKIVNDYGSWQEFGLHFPSTLGANSAIYATYAKQC